MSRPTAKDVAELAGVSRSAVSMVLNGRGDGNIAPAKQQAVLDAARELGYTPDAVALSLRTQRTRTLGLVTDGIASSAFGGRLLEAATATADAHGYVVVVADTHFDAHREDRSLRVLHDRRVDGLLLAAMSNVEVHPHPQVHRVPAVLAHCVDADGVLPSYVPDERDGGRRAAQALLDAGHRDVVLLAGTEHSVTYSHLRAVAGREAGYRDALSAAGLPVRDPVETGWEVADGYRAATAVLSGVRPGERPTGVLCANDRVAVGVVLAACALGLSVPRDLSVVGFDDDESLAATMVPALTTVQLPFREMGERAVLDLLARLSGEEDDEAPAGSTLLPCPLVERGSVAPPR